MPGRGARYANHLRGGRHGSIILHAVDSDGVTLGDGSSPNYGAVAKMENSPKPAGYS